MSSDFPRILTLLRKEKNISQKKASAELGISQALLSHYEKGIRECGLDFLVRCADFYQVSCDYLLGRTPDRTGTQLTVDDIPEPDAAGKENRSAGSILTVLNKKLIANSMNVLFDLLAKTGSKSLTGEVSAFLMLAVYRMFRVVYSINPRNQQSMFQLPAAIAPMYADAAMQISEANAGSVAQGQPVYGMEKLDRAEAPSVDTESLSRDYPLFASSLLNLIQNAESRVDYSSRGSKK
ncbi:helix-turn-helix transcriptional regulator [Oscillospiraceae bacterium MB08-C2-2]|nr:helix-turn-helix transcriptional regulator [Oscillospiraceae bacterium MB08-C2-2]